MKHGRHIKMINKADCIHTSISISHSSNIKIQQIANRKYHGNKSIAIDNIIMEYKDGTETNNPIEPKIVETEKEN